jgi:hypothetical protein
MTETNTDALREIVLGRLVPLLTTGTGADITLARRAAEQAIEDHRSQTPGQLITASQVTAFALAALDTLRLSMANDLPLATTLKLRGAATGLNRAALDAGKSLERARRMADHAPNDWALNDWALNDWTLTEWGTGASDAPTPPDAPEAPEPPAPEPVPDTLPVAEQNRRHWANAMVTAAAELKARAGQVPPAQRKSDALWMEVLADVAGELRQPNSAPVGLSKADLFRTTLMAGSGGFPAHLVGKPSPRRARG